MEKVFLIYSFCAFSSIIHKDENNIKKQIYEGFIRPTCYEMYCSNKSLTIKINNQYKKKKKKKTEFTTDLIHHYYLPGLCRQSLSAGV